MDFPVYWCGELVGVVAVSETPYAYTFDMRCPLVTTEILRGYGVTADAPLRIGVLEPQNDVLVLKRTVTRQSVGGVLPQKYYLSNQQAALNTPLWNTKNPTGDALLDFVLQNGAVQAERLQGVLQLTCPFDSSKPFALAFAFALCAVELREEGAVAVFSSPSVARHWTENAPRDTIDRKHTPH